jgi:protein-S-isoprenylcysteine O-methyltransferase Ste14
VRLLYANNAMTKRAQSSLDLRRLVFKYRSYTPIPFLVAMVIFAKPTVTSLLIGLLIVVLGEAIRFWGVAIAGSETRTTGKVGGTFLITNGPFAHVRNPLYVGNMLLYAGVGVMSSALFPWLLVVAVLFFYMQYTLIVSQEEEYLASAFDESFSHYTQHVRRFLPRLTAYQSPKAHPKAMNMREGLASERRTLQAICLVTVIILIMFLTRN